MYLRGVDEKAARFTSTVKFWNIGRMVALLAQIYDLIVAQHNCTTFIIHVMHSRYSGLCDWLRRFANAEEFKTSIDFVVGLIKSYVAHISRFHTRMCQTLLDFFKQSIEIF